MEGDRSEEVEVDEIGYLVLGGCLIKVLTDAGQVRV